ncbi:5-formyltetrahydrofolate cyclo-ligase, putative [Talaromyces stipitatus ATCC 10500]|uniref:5-formyltetrahydrofolate cyclo-ligase n=1 Tax=Talaromyces stipitatus (strain ATCC 10500 / CBS 375.48 / QM 6759 / NRRL 1006) TaxID=441959 RepID=B8M3V6_TALSN|nr:5-formyltetrahydrofolate cyclo-ligase, putative [Talaromyces stipitatus ATCC 10500]EED20699.1 5-formyltetrahydrofolate cyclo-ligase, putative [Talaromyces stipitatus ATCC 10500]
MAAVQVAKKDLRRKIQNLLKEVPRESVNAQSTVVTNKLFTLPEYRNARRVSIFLSMPSGEISTAGIVRDALDRGKEVFVPYTHRLETGDINLPKVSVMDMLRLESMEEFESLQPDKWGIPSLDKDSVPRRQNCLGGTGVLAERSRGVSDDIGLDLIVMPGMAFDTDLRRLGHGKGYYDYFLNNYNREIAGSPRASQRPFLVAVALKEQIVIPPDEIPVANHDQPVDAIIVGDGRLIFANGRLMEE